MRIQKYTQLLYWLPLTLFYSLDANAWGLYTHVYFAQSLLLATPLLDKRFRRAIIKFPELVMAGACLPDLSVVAKQFNTTHQWQQAEKLIAHAHTDQETAIAIGYASHLYVDVIAHNHFVPAHEALWNNESLLTHIAAEWAMDVHVQKHLNKTPGQLLTTHATIISQFIAPCFAQSQSFTKRKLTTLAYADRLLRLAKLPTIIHKCIALNNKEKHKHYDYYLSKTNHALQNFHQVLNGHRPNWQPELKIASDLTRINMWRKHCLETLHINHAEPIRYYSIK